MRSIFKTAVVAAIAAAFVGSVAIAGGQQAGEQRRGPGFGQGRMGGPGGPGGRGFGPGFLRGLDLTEQQREQIKAIHEAHAQQDPPADMKLRQQLELELLADAPNEQTIESLKQQIAAAQVQMLTRHVTVQKQISQILTAEQRAKAREQVAEGPRGPGRRGFGLR